MTPANAHIPVIDMEIAGRVWNITVKAVLKQAVERMARGRKANSNQPDYKPSSTLLSVPYSEAKINKKALAEPKSCKSLKVPRHKLAASLKL